MIKHLGQVIQKIYVECVEEVFGKKCLQVEISMMRDYVVILEPKQPVSVSEAFSRCVRGHNIEQAEHEWRRQHFHIRLGQELTAATHFQILSIHSDALCDSHERVTIVRFDRLLHPDLATDKRRPQLRAIRSL